MSEFPFGERYFATRERLSSVMLGIAALANETGTSVAQSLPLEEIKSGLGSPFLFVVCGEVNAGKSTLINGLFGQDLCKVNILPETHRVLWYRYGSPSRNLEISPLLQECYRPVDFLRDFNLIDTPGTNSVEQGHQEITERFLPAADLILFVFPVSNPWGGATWNFVSKLPREALERVAFIVQQSDQREPGDIDVILGHMADLSMKRIGHVPPIFAVSGKLAYEAKRATPFAGNRLKASGFPALEDFITKSVCQSPTRRNALETWRAQASSALRSVEDRIEEQTRTINGQDHFIRTIEQEIDAIRESFVNRLPRHLAGVAAIFESEAVWVTKVLRKRMRAFPSIIRLFIGDRTGHQMESIFIGRLQEAVVAVAEKDGEEAVDACQAHWKGLGPRVKTETGIDLAGDEPVEATLSLARKRFVKRLERAASQGIGNLNVRNQLVKDLHRRNIALKSFTFCSLGLVTTSACCGALAVPWAPWILLVLAGTFQCGGIWVAWITRKTITREFQQRLLDTCGAFASTLRNDYEEALRIVLRDYASRLGHVRTHLAHEKMSIEPRLKRWQELFLTLKTIEQDL